MTNSILPAAASNEDPLWDPAWAQHEAHRLLEPQLTAADDVLSFGVALIKRLFHTSIGSVEDLVLIGANLRQAVATFDGWLHDAKAGAVEAAALHLRALFEADLASQWVFSKGKERWAKQLYVATVRRNRIWARRMIAGTQEHTEFDAMWVQRTGESYQLQAEVVAQAANEIANITALLNSPSYEAINKNFEASKGKYEPAWHKPGPNGVPTIAAMAAALNRQADYTAIYSGLSQLAHGSDTDHHFSVRDPGHPVIEPIRNPARLGLSCTLAASFFFAVLRRYLEHYRADEVPVFNRKYADNWRPILFPPSIRVDETIVQI